MDCSLPGSSIHGASQAIMLERVVIFFSRGFLQPRDWMYISCTAFGQIIFTAEPQGKPSKMYGQLLKKKTTNDSTFVVNWLFLLYYYYLNIQ